MFESNKANLSSISGFKSLLVAWPLVFNLELIPSNKVRSKSSSLIL